LKLYDLNSLCKLMGGEYVLGTKDLHSKACYLIYGLLNPGEGDRLIKPGDGYEEILCGIDGELLIDNAGIKTPLPSGFAMHIQEDQCFYISNPSQETRRYILAGGKKSD
jgi:hypothetical protein